MILRVPRTTSLLIFSRDFCSQIFTISIRDLPRFSRVLKLANSSTFVSQSTPTRETLKVTASRIFRPITFHPPRSASSSSLLFVSSRVLEIDRRHFKRKSSVRRRPRVPSVNRRNQFSRNPQTFTLRN